jgi:hypothetical protein
VCGLLAPDLGTSDAEIRLKRISRHSSDQAVPDGPGPPRVRREAALVLSEEGESPLSSSFARPLRNLGYANLGSGSLETLGRAFRKE